MKKKVAGLAAFVAIALMTAQSFAKTPNECLYARYHPGFAIACMLQMLADAIYGGAFRDSGDADGLGG